MVDLRIPPAFNLLTGDLQEYHEERTGQKSGQLEKLADWKHGAFPFLHLAFSVCSVQEIRETNGAA